MLVGSVPACYGNSLGLGSNSDIYQKYKMGDIRKGVATKKYPKKLNKKLIYKDWKWWRTPVILLQGGQIVGWLEPGGH